MKTYNLFENWTESRDINIRQLRLLGYSIPWMYECSSNGLVLTRGLIVKTEPDLSLILVGQKGNKTKIIHTLYPIEFKDELLPNQIDNIIDGETLIIDANQDNFKLQLQAWIPKNERTLEIIELLRSRILRLSKLKTDNKGVFIWKV